MMAEHVAMAAYRSNLMSTQTNDTRVTASRVAENKRAGFLPRFLGRHLMQGEGLVYGWMSRLCEDYQGGYWEFYTLSNEGFYMAPTRAEPMRLQHPDNYLDAEMSADAAGIVVTLFALCEMANRYGEDRLVDHYHALREFALGHAEATLILKAIG
jgi:hypothetical protein